MSVLVTGAAGYIGRIGALALERKARPWIGLDDFARSPAGGVLAGRIVTGRIEDAALVRRMVRDHGVDEALHFAGLIDVAESVREPALYHRENVEHAARLLETLVSAGVKRIVYSSSAAVYGAASAQALTESAPLAPVNPYGESKLAVERLLAGLERSHGLRWMALRYFNAAGADPQGEAGESHAHETHLIPLAIAAARGRREALAIHGTDYDTPDGTCIRDYVHVSDLADAHLAALDYLRKGGASAALNLGTGRGHSVREVVDAVGRATGRPVPVREGPRRAGDPPRLVADASAARATLGWTPRHADLADMVAHASRWDAKYDSPSTP